MPHFQIFPLHVNPYYKDTGCYPVVPSIYTRNFKAVFMRFTGYLVYGVVYEVEVYTSV